MNNVFSIHSESASVCEIVIIRCCEARAMLNSRPPDALHAWRINNANCEPRALACSAPTSG